MHDALNLLSKLTPKRFFNGLNIWRSYRKALRTGVPSISGMPVSLSIEPTTSCNLRCPECPSGLRQFTRPTGMLDMELYKKVIEELSPTLLYLILYFQGEPYLHPHFFELVRFASERKIYTATSTNAHYLDDENARKTVESGLDRLVISIDGTTQDTYESYRIGGKLEKVIEGTKRVIEWKKKLKSKTPHILFQFLVVKPNEHQIEDVRKLAKELGVDELGLKTAQIYDYKNGNPLIPTIDKFSRYAKNPDGTYRIKSDLDNGCWKMWHSAVMTQSGEVVPCCFDKDAKHGMGSVVEDSFSAVWNGKKYQGFRQALLKSRKSIDICTNCTEGVKIWG